MSEISGLILDQKKFYYRGRVALAQMLAGLSIAEGDEVATQAFTCVAVPEAIFSLGAKPIYVDIEKNNVNMDPKDLELKITDKTKAIVIQHTFGVPAKLDELLKIAEQKNIPVIEDCCHTLESTYADKKVGKFGVGAFYSFEWGKPLVAGLGGAAMINDQAIISTVQTNYQNMQVPSSSSQLKLWVQYQAYRILYRPAIYWTVKKAYHFFAKKGVVNSNYNADIKSSIADDFNYKIPPQSFRRLTAAMKKQDKITAHSQLISDYYQKNIKNTNCNHMQTPNNAESIFARYPLQVKDKVNLLKLAERYKIELADWYTTPIHPIPNEQLENVDYQLGSCPNAEEMSKHIVSLPTNLRTSLKQAKKIVQFLNENA